MRILYTHTSSLIGGGNKVLLSVLSELDRSRFQPFSVIPEHGPMEAELRARDVPYLIRDLRPKARSALTTAQTLVSLVLNGARRGVQLLHANDPLTYRMASVGLSAIGTRRVCHVHHPGQTAESMRWSFRKQPDLVLTPSEMVREQICAAVGAQHAQRIVKVGNPIDVDWFAPEPDVQQLRRQLGLDTTGPHITILGAIAPHKGHDCFLRMAARIRSVLPGAKFHVIGSARTGDAAWAARLDALVQELGLSEAVRFWGFVADDAARDILRASDLFVLPTREEGFCLVVAEAQACGVPVITSAIRPLDEVVLDGSTGWLLPPDDDEQFAHHALQLLGAPDAYRAMSAAGRQFVVERFGHKAFAQRVMALYDSVHSSRSRADVNLN